MSLLGAFAPKNGAARRRRRARAVCVVGTTRAALFATGAAVRVDRKASPLPHMSLLAITPHGSVREGVLGLAARRDGSGRDSYALGPVAFQMASVTQALVSIWRRPSLG